MEGFHAAVGDKSARIFFIVFHIINVVSYTGVAYIRKYVCAYTCTVAAPCSMKQTMQACHGIK